MDDLKPCIGRALIAEDHALNRAVIRKILGHVGLDCTFAEDGFEAVDTFRSGRFDLVLLDLNMPRMDGWEAAFQMRAYEHETGTKTLIFALSACALPKARDRCFEVGMDGFLAKPLRIDEIRQVIRDHILPRAA